MIFSVKARAPVKNSGKFYDEKPVVAVLGYRKDGCRQKTGKTNQCGMKGLETDGNLYG